ncbi:outer membrane protein [Deinococcus metalli]|uniref:Outer membrane protein n=1 Tax=Deinococcus metalli TaxID=1141878 RepID=A0A7W8KEQ6_9DEIO|nr:TolC family protein [Deinococcus metalli]MBB5375661.1 outer membrane protein [Deinococcus metalli]GHF37988.1 transporter [Deinococcus metalli]
MTLCPRAPAPLLRAVLTAGLALGVAAHAQTAPAQTTPAQSSPAQITTTTAPASLTLDAALAQLSGAPSVTQAQLSVQVAQRNLDAARTALGLTVSVTGNAAYTGPGTATASDGTTTSLSSSLSGSAGVNVSLGLLPWSNNQSSLRGAQRSLDLAQANLLEAGASARLNVSQQYYAAVLAVADIDLAQRTLELRQRQLSVAQTQQAAGNATAETVLNAQAALQTAQAAQVQASASLDAARRSLGAALGQSVNATAFPTTPAETVTLPDIAALVARARTSRSEVVQARNTLAAAQDALDEQKRTQTLPDISASVRYGPSGSGGLSANLNLTQGTVGAGYSVPLGESSGSSTSDRISASISGSYVVYSPAAAAQVSAAQASVTQAQLSLTVAQQTVELDVRTRSSTLQTSVIAVQTRATAVQLAQTALDTAQARLQAGTGTADDVSVAELALAQAQRDLVSARVTAQLNLLQLTTAAGGPA